MGLIVAVGAPVLQWATMMIFDDLLGPVPPASVWLRFVLVMAVFAIPASAAMYRATQTGAGQFARSFAFALAMASGMVPKIHEFARDPLHQFLLYAIVQGLVYTLLFSGIFYAIGIPKSPVEKT